MNNSIEEVFNQTVQEAIEKYNLPPHPFDTMSDEEKVNHEYELPYLNVSGFET